MISREIEKQKNTLKIIFTCYQWKFACRKRIFACHKQMFSSCLKRISTWIKWTFFSAYKRFNVILKIVFSVRWNFFKSLLRSLHLRYYCCQERIIRAVTIVILLNKNSLLYFKCTSDLLWNIFKRKFSILRLYF